VSLTITAADIETSLGLPAGSVTLTISDGVVTFTGADQIPQSITLSSELWRLRALCTRRGKDANVAAGIATLTENQQHVANARWNYCGSLIQRDEWLSKKLRVWMGYTNKQFDDFFTAAQAL